MSTFAFDKKISNIYGLSEMMCYDEEMQATLLFI